VTDPGASRREGRSPGWPAAVSARRATPVSDVPGAFAQTVVDSFLAHARESDAPYLLVLSGGATARHCYEALAERGDAIDWGRVVVTLGDERCVAADDPESNQLLVRQALLERIGPVGGFVPLYDAPGTSTLEQRFASGIYPNLVHLGLGPDGHTASLFPDSPALCASPDRLVVRNTDPTGRNPLARMTWTFAAIARARLAVFTVAGEEKAAAYQAVRRGIPVPAARIGARRVEWLVDQAAASIDRS